MGIDLNDFTLEVGDEIVVSDRKMADNTREGKIVGIEDKTEVTQYLVHLPETTVKRPKINQMIDVKLDAKTLLLQKNQLRKNEA